MSQETMVSLVEHFIIDSLSQFLQKLDIKILTERFCGVLMVRTPNLKNTCQNKLEKWGSWYDLLGPSVLHIQVCHANSSNQLLLTLPTNFCLPSFAWWINRQKEREREWLWLERRGEINKSPSPTQRDSV